MVRVIINEIEFKKYVKSRLNNFNHLGLNLFSLASLLAGIFARQNFCLPIKVLFEPQGIKIGQEIAN